MKKKMFLENLKSNKQENIIKNDVLFMLNNNFNKKLKEIIKK